MASKDTGRWMAAGCCVAIVAALQFGGASESAGTSASRESRSASQGIVASAPILRVARIPTLAQPQSIGLDIGVARKAVRDGQLRIALPDGSTYPL